MVFHVMLVEGVLTHCVEQRNLLQLILSKATDRVVSQSIIVLDLTNYIFGVKFDIIRDFLNLRGIIKPVRFSLVKGADDTTVPIKVFFVLILRRLYGLLQDVRLVVPVVHDGRLRAVGELVQFLANVLQSGLFVHLFEEPLSHILAIVVEFHEVVHVLDTVLHPFVVLLDSTILFHHLKCRQFQLRHCSILMPSPFGRQECML